MSVLAAIPPPPFHHVEIAHLRITAHALLTLVPIFVAVALTARRWRARGGSTDLVFDVAVWSVVAGIVGARLYHLATSWSEVPKTWWGPFAIWEGGLASWGSLLFGALAAVWVLRRRGASVAAFLDAAAPGVLLAYGIGRLGNYFNQELFGTPTSLPWGLEVAPAFRPAGYEAYASFHPTFLYELVWDVALVGLLLVAERRLRPRPPGLFLLFLAGYGFGRIFEELLRIDPSLRLFGLRLNFYVATALFLTSSAIFLWSQRRLRPPGAPASA